MSARKPDAWSYYWQFDRAKGQWRLDLDDSPPEPGLEVRDLQCLYVLTDADFEAIKWAADQADAWTRYMDNEGITAILKPEAIAKRQALAAALRSIVEGKA